jgi:hypothetical protein
MATEIPEEQPTPDHWYAGGRLGPLTMWTGKLFVGWIASKTWRRVVTVLRTEA